METDRALAYLCDGTEAQTAVATWLTGASSATTFDLEASGVHVAGTLSGDSVSGNVVLADGTKHAFSTAPVAGAAGVYRDGASYVGALGGWVVLGDGSIRGAVRIDGTGLLPVTSTLTSVGTVTATSGNLNLTGTRVTTTRPAPNITAPDSGASCTAATTCSGHGVCSSAGTCACNVGFAGASCNSCATGFFGFPTCKACAAATTCSGHGTCDGSGNCACNEGFAGVSCAGCVSGFFGYPFCKFCSAATTCNGHGTCDPSGNCLCSAGFSGPTCQ